MWWSSIGVLTSHNPVTRGGLCVVRPLSQNVAV